MKHYIKILVVLFVSCLFTLDIQAGDIIEKEDTLANDLKIQLLLNKKKHLEQKIAAADKNRNIHKNNMSYETIELLNDRQDSICLTLRSKLVDVNLEIKEIIPTAEYARYVLMNSSILNKKNSDIRNSKEK